MNELNEPVKIGIDLDVSAARPERPRTWTERWGGLILFAIFFGVLLSGIVYHHWDVVQVSEEAVVRSGVGSDLLAGRASGRQGLIGSLNWAPLPTLLGLPFLYVPRLGSAGLAWPVLAAAMSAFTIVLLNRWGRSAGVPWPVRYIVLIGYQLSPPVLGAVLAGSGAMLLLLLCVAGLHFLYHWLATLDLRSLAYLGTLAGLAVVTDWRMIVVVSAVLLVVVLRLLWVYDRKNFSQATLLVYLVPVVYLVTVWTVSNWLIMGDPLFFLRGLFAGVSAIPALLEWSLYLLPPTLLTLGVGYGYFVARRRPGSSVLAGLLVVGMVAAVGLSYVLELRADASSLATYPQQVRTVDEIISYVEDRYPDSRVVVSGYFGYQFRVRAHRPELFVHFINLSLSQVDNRTRGKELFLLLPRPESTGAWEDVHLNHRGLFENYENYEMTDGAFVAGFVFEERWPAGNSEPQWLLLRMILRDKPSGGGDT